MTETIIKHEKIPIICWHLFWYTCHLAKAQCQKMCFFNVFLGSEKVVEIFSIVHIAYLFFGNLIIMNKWVTRTSICTIRYPESWSQKRKGNAGWSHAQKVLKVLKICLCTYMCVRNMLKLPYMFLLPTLYVPCLRFKERKKKIVTRVPKKPLHI